MSSFTQLVQVKVVTTFSLKSGGIIKLALFVLALILLLAYLGITFTDIKNNDFVQYLVLLVISFFL